MPNPQSVYWLAVDIALCVILFGGLWRKLAQVEREVARVVALIGDRSQVAPIGEAFVHEQFESVRASMQEFCARLDHIENRVDNIYQQFDKGRGSGKKSKPTPAGEARLV